LTIDLTDGTFVRAMSTFETFSQDFQYALRGFRREPVVALVAVIILALGIGSNTAVFSIVNPLVLKPLPFPDADRLVWIANIGTSGLSGRTYRVDVFEEFQRNAKSLQSMDRRRAKSKRGGRKSSETQRRPQQSSRGSGDDQVTN
jgi:hypothetical protein